MNKDREADKWGVLRDSAMQECGRPSSSAHGLQGLGKSLNISELQFLICRMGTIAVAPEKDHPFLNNRD